MRKAFCLLALRVGVLCQGLWASPVGELPRAETGAASAIRFSMVLQGMDQGQLARDLDSVLDLGPSALLSSEINFPSGNNSTSATSPTKAAILRPSASSTPPPRARPTAGKPSGTVSGSPGILRNLSGAGSQEKTTAVAVLRTGAAFDGRPAGADEDALPVDVKPQAPNRPPSAKDLLARAAAKGISIQRIGAAIQDSNAFIAVVEKLEALGLLAPGEIDPTMEDHAHFLRFALHGLWWEAAPRLPAQFRVDESRAIPALVVEKDGILFHVHGIVHGLGDFPPIRRGRVLALVKELKRQGLPLYSEEKLAGFFGYSYGKETTDLRARAGLPVEVRRLPAAPARKGFGLVLPAGLPLYRGYFHALALLARWKYADHDLAAHFHNLARVVYGRIWSLPEVARVELPMPLKASVDEAAVRARQSPALAEAVLRDAKTEGYREAHIVTGYNHASEVAWALRP